MDPSPRHLFNPSSQASTYQDSQDESLKILSSSEPPAIKLLDTVEIKLLDVAVGEKWERHVVHQIDSIGEDGEVAAVSVHDLTEQVFKPSDLKAGTDVRRASVPASLEEKKVGVFARAEFIFKTGENFSWDSALYLGGYKIVHTYDANRSTPHDFRAYHSDAAKSSDYFCKGLKTLAEKFFSGDLLVKALAIAKARPSFGPPPPAAAVAPACVLVALPPALAPEPPAPLTTEDVARFMAEAEEAEEALTQHDDAERTEETKFKEKVAHVSGAELHTLVEQYGQNSKRARETRDTLAKQRSEKRAKWEVNDQLLHAEESVRTLKQKTAEAARKLEQAKEAEAQADDTAKELRARAARCAATQPA